MTESELKKKWHGLKGAPSPWRGVLRMGLRLSPRAKQSQVHYKGMATSIDPLPMPRVK